MSKAAAESVPAGARALENPVGTAPCFIVKQAGSVIIALPGVPREMRRMLDVLVEVGSGFGGKHRRLALAS